MIRVAATRRHPTKRAIGSGRDHLPSQVRLEILKHDPASLGGQPSLLAQAQTRDRAGRRNSGCSRGDLALHPVIFADDRYDHLMTRSRRHVSEVRLGDCDGQKCIFESLSFQSLARSLPVPVTAGHICVG